MFELIKHLLGLCPDHATHMNIMDMLLGGGFLAFAGGYFHRIKGIFTRKSGDPHQNCNHSHSRDDDHDQKH